MMHTAKTLLKASFLALGVMWASLEPLTYFVGAELQPTVKPFWPLFYLAAVGFGAAYTYGQRIFAAGLKSLQFSCRGAVNAWNLLPRFVRYVVFVTVPGICAVALGVVAGRHIGYHLLTHPELRLYCVVGLLILAATNPWAVVGIILGSVLDGYYNLRWVVGFCRYETVDVKDMVFGLYCASVVWTTVLMLLFSGPPRQLDKAEETGAVNRRWRRCPLVCLSHFEHVMSVRRSVPTAVA